MKSFSTLDLLENIDDDKRIAISYLMHHPNSSMERVADGTGILVEVVAHVIDELIDQGRVAERFLGQERVFSIRLGRRKQHIRNVPGVIKDSLNQSITSTFSGAPITRDLDASIHQALIARASVLVLSAGDVLTWQNQSCSDVQIVRYGLLKITRLTDGAQQNAQYACPGTWIGLAESLGDEGYSETCTAVVDTELYFWKRDVFIELMMQFPALSVQVCRWISQHSCCRQAVTSHIWSIESMHAAGSTTIAQELAAYTCQHTGTDRSTRRILLVYLQEPAPTPVLPGIDTYVLRRDNAYPAEVQIDILLTAWSRKYEIIICDLGSQQHNRLAWVLHSQAHVAMTVLTHSDQQTIIERLSEQRTAQRRLGQKRVLIINRMNDAAETHVTAQVVIPHDQQLPIIREHGELVIHAAPDSIFAQGIAEIHRRLTLTHSIGVFIPSTIDVSAVIDNNEQVQATLTFLGETFGGATRNDAEGAWNSQESGVVVERITVVRSYVSKPVLEAHLDTVIQFVLKLKQDMRQEAMAIDIDNQLVLV